MDFQQPKQSYEHRPFSGRARERERERGLAVRERDMERERGRARGDGSVAAVRVSLEVGSNIASDAGAGNIRRDNSRDRHHKNISSNNMSRDHNLPVRAFANSNSNSRGDSRSRHTDRQSDSNHFTINNHNNHNTRNNGPEQRRQDSNVARSVRDDSHQRGPENRSNSNNRKFDYLPDQKRHSR